jgi:hypothetical protein
MNYGLHGLGSIPGSARFVSSPRRSYWPWESPAHIPMQQVLILSLEVKGPGREASHSRPSSAKAKQGGAVHLLSYMSSWHSAQLIKRKFTFYKLVARRDDFKLRFMRRKHCIQCGTSRRLLLKYYATIMPRSHLLSPLPISYHQ